MTSEGDVTILTRTFKIIVQLFLPIEVDIHVPCVRIEGGSMLTLNGGQEQTKCEKDKTWVTSVPNSSVVLCEVCQTKLSKYGQYRMDREQNNIGS